ncbi:MAG TPA: proton-conducting transporter membrane subunit [Oscillatoriaceae cyanobacterium]
MLSPDIWLLALGPLAIAGGGIVCKRGVVRGQVVTWACAFNLAVAAITAVLVALHGVLLTGTLGLGGVGLGLYVDSLAAAMFCLVSFIGLIVVAYSHNYMQGDPAHGSFTRSLCLTLVSVLFLTISGNLFQFLLAWLGMGFGLQTLLLFYPERRAAVLGARKHLIATLLGSFCLLAVLAILYRLFGSLDYTAIFAGAAALRGASVLPASIHAAALLLAIAGLLRSAQFPTHGWLMEVMETPTPVSALLHAGIINAGGFLILRFSKLVSLSLPSLETLVLIGGFTAIFGSVVMLAKTSIKVKLATSTVAQMGFMMLECGLGAFPAALLHIIAHSLYKAHAFLSSGSVIDMARASWSLSPGGKPHPLRQVVAVLAVLAIGFVLGRTFGAAPTEQPGVFALGAVLLLGLVHLVSSGIDVRPSAYVIGRTVLYALGVGIAYFSLQIAMMWLFSGSIPIAAALHGPFALSVEAVVVAAFAVVTILQGRVPGDAQTPRWQALYALVWHGFYVNTLINRLLMQVWPLRTVSRS